MAVVQFLAPFLCRWWNYGPFLFALSIIFILVVLAHVFHVYGCIWAYVQHGRALSSFRQNLHFRNLYQLQRRILLLFKISLVQNARLSNSQKLLVFLIINLCFMAVELSTGRHTNSLGLVTDAFHMLFDCAALAIGLLPLIISKRGPNDEILPYGASRVEALAGFINGVFLCLTSLTSFVRSIRRLFLPPEVLTDNLLLVSFLGLTLNLIGIFIFHPHSNTEPSELKRLHYHHCHSEYSENLYSIFLHLLSDTLSSVGLIISTYLLKYYDWKIADPIFSLCISVFILLSTVPFLKKCTAEFVRIHPGNSSQSHKPALSKNCQPSTLPTAASSHSLMHLASYSTQPNFNSLSIDDATRLTAPESKT